MEGQHLTTIPPIQREAVERKFKSVGVDMDRVQEIYLGRWTYNMFAYSQLGDIITAEKNNDPRFIPDQEGLF